MTSFAPVMALGLFLGMRHATDADHVIAVTTIVARQRTARAAAAIGAAWGIGHTFTILLVGTGIIVFGWVIPPRVGLSTELTVGAMLILLGAVNLAAAVRDIRATAATETVTPEAETPGHSHTHVHSHAHVHGDYVHTHPHGHTPEVHPHKPEQTPLARLDKRFGSIGAYQLVRPLVVGVVHGLAGSAAVTLLVLTTIQSPSWAILYLLIFGLGTIVGMMLMTAVIALPFTHAGNRFARISGGLRVATSILSVAFGLLIAYRVGIIQGLFTS